SIRYMTAGTTKYYSFSAAALDAGAQNVTFEVTSETSDPVAADNAQQVSLNVMTDPTLEDTGGGGGCVVNNRSPADPVLPLLLLMAVTWVGLRRFWQQ
ncbi:MAG: JDVT-CTERM domain-containing protein, partial [Chromatiales bacterium]|nr:JDVT-CTERM domain-containing protein [Chromatiales bacterium]